MGDVLQSDLPAVDAHQLRGDRPRAGNAVSKHRANGALCLLGLRVAPHRRVAGLARAQGRGNGAVITQKNPAIPDRATQNAQGTRTPTSEHRHAGTSPRDGSYFVAIVIQLRQIDAGTVRRSSEAPLR